MPRLASLPDRASASAGLLLLILAFAHACALGYWLYVIWANRNAPVPPPLSKKFKEFKISCAMDDPKPRRQFNTAKAAEAPKGAFQRVRSYADMPTSVSGQGSR